MAHNLSQQANKIHMTHQNYRPDIDGLRGIAILSVVAFHAFPKTLPSGFIGVDIFFVISGYLISRIIFSNLEEKRFSFGEFYIHRIRRIFPALILVLSTALVLGAMLLFSDEYKQIGKHVIGSVGFFSNYIYLNEAGYFDNSGQTKPLLHLWSLAIEEQFYLVWPLLSFIAWKRNWGFLLVTIVVAILSFATNIYLTSSNPLEAFYSPLSRSWELMAGALLAYFTLNYKEMSGKAGNIVSIAGLCLLLTGFVFINKSMSFPGWWVLFPVTGSVLIILAGPYRFANNKLLSNKTLVWFGLISYPLYLWHWLLLSFGMIINSETIPQPEIRNPVIPLSIVLAWCTYRYVEKPIRSIKSKLTYNMLITGLLGVGCVALSVYIYDGFKLRSASTLGNYSYDFRFPPAFRNPCEISKQIGDSSGGQCNDGNVTTNPSVVLLGDSFATSFSQVLLYSNNYFKFSYKQFGGGPPLLNYGPQIWQNEYKYYFELIKNSESIKIVILSAAWPGYVNGYTTINKAIFPPQKFSSDEFKKSFIETLKFLVTTNKRIIISLAPPAPAKPRACLPRPLKLSNDCDIPLSLSLSHDAGSREFIKNTLLKFPSVKVYDPYDYLCNKKVCIVSNDNRILYIDGGHLSKEGGKYLADQSHSVLKELFYSGNNDQ